MSTFACKAIIYKGSGRRVRSLWMRHGLGHPPMLLPRSWLIEERPSEVEDHEFGKGFDFRRVAGFSCNNVFEHEMDGMEYLANFSCCRECAERAVQCGYAVWADKEYPMTLR